MQDMVLNIYTDGFARNDKISPSTDIDHAWEL